MRKIVSVFAYKIKHYFKKHYSRIASILNKESLKVLYAKAKYDESSFKISIDPNIK